MNRNKESCFPAPTSGLVALVLCFCLALLVAGCGQRGALYLPEKEPAVQEAETGSEPEKDPEENDEENS